MKDTVVAAFDFDGTITTKDTFVPFLCDVFGSAKVLKAFARVAPKAALSGRGIFNRDVYKEHLVQALFSGEPVEAIDQRGTHYAKSLKTFFRPAALERIDWHISKGHRCILVSASLDVYLDEVARALGFDDLLCTVLSRKGQVFDGALLGGNCRRQEKVNRLQSLLGDVSTYTLFAYGDSTGDREMLALADYGYYRPFESGKPSLTEKYTI